MKNLSTFKVYHEELIIEEIIKYIDLSLNESTDYKDLFSKVVNKIKNLSLESKKKVLKYFIGTVLAYFTLTNIYTLINNSLMDNETKKVAIEVVDEKFKLKSGDEFKLSKSGLEHIKKEEGCKLKVYSLGDGKLTVGYGHAEPISKTKLKLGKKISQEEADKFLMDDLTEAADGVRRIFKQWKEKGNDVKITQSMFDALVSLAFNTGVSSLRQSEIIKNLKSKEFKVAADSIKEYNIDEKFPGLKTRRQKESQMFLTGIQSKN